MTTSDLSNSFDEFGIDAPIRALIGTVAAHYEATGSWMTFNDLAYDVHDHVRPYTPDDAFRVPGILGNTAGSEHLQLTGLALVLAGTAPSTVSLMVRLAKISAERKARIRPDARLGREILIDEYGFDEAEAVRAQHILELLPGITGSANGGDFWSCELFRTALEYSAIETVDDLRELLEERVRKQLTYNARSFAAASAATDAVSNQLAVPAPDVDFFICHASIDKLTVASPLAEELRSRDFAVWLDALNLTVGDSLRQHIDEALTACRFGIVILSEAFFQRQWPQSELSALFARQMQGTKVILPVWHEIDETYLLGTAPLLAGYLGVSTSKGIEFVADEIIRAAGRAVPDRPAEAAAEEDLVLKFPLTRSAHQRLLDERPQAWEYLLFADILATEKERLEPRWRAHQLKLRKTGGHQVAFAEAGDYLSGAVADLTTIVGNVERLLDAEFQVSVFGSPGVPGDPDLIHYLASEVMAQYEAILEWAADLRRSRVEAKLQPAFDLAAAFADQPLHEMRAWVHQCLTSLGEVPRLLAVPNPEPITIDLTLTITADTALLKAFDEATARLSN